MISRRSLIILEVPRKQYKISKAVLADVQKGDLQNTQAIGNTAETVFCICPLILGY
jgi:hypothetical protein